ncbi:hypothetical protein ACHAW5_009074 [Stephanodiscus triporus]|uniref:Ubiquinone biosynthesis protein COQ4 homolog, mitochondrial n=1 Tax=Stephanodiscus triporus TaxID=2934178 RepID=A0ABD3NEG9_9STRA
MSATRDPTRHDAVAAVGEVVGTYALSRMMAGMMDDDSGRRVMRDRPYVDGSTVALASSYASYASTSSPPSSSSSGGGAAAVADDDDDDDDGTTTTFGAAYASFLDRHSFDPEDRTIVRYVSDPDLAYVATRYRQCHDYWHVLSGLPPTVLGESALKSLELVQTGMPLSALSVLASLSSYAGLLDDDDRRVLRETYLPWAMRTGRNMREHVLMSTYYELEFGTDLNALRDRMGIEAAPIVES